MAQPLHHLDPSLLRLRPGGQRRFEQERTQATHRRLAPQAVPHRDHEGAEQTLPVALQDQSLLGPRLCRGLRAHQEEHEVSLLGVTVDGRSLCLTSLQVAAIPVSQQTALDQR